jgi:hypothetical protein
VDVAGGFQSDLRGCYMMLCTNVSAGISQSV